MPKPVCGNDPVLPEASNVSRRNLLAMLPAAAVAADVPTHGLAEEGEGSGEIMRLFGDSVS